MRIIDLRSDTVTHPTSEMRQAMAQAELGDDVYGDDPTVNRLEKLSAEIFGKEAALFVPSGTFANQLALLTHCRRGDEVILGDDCHIVQHEGGGAAVIAGVQLRTVQCEQGQMSLKDIESRIRKFEDIHYPRTGLICLENAYSNGCALPLDYIHDVADVARFYEVPLYMDGARVFNAIEYLQVEPHELAEPLNSLMFCLSKGLCAPVGSMLVGSGDFIERARKNRKIMGGGMRQAGVLAAAGIIALEKMRSRLGQDHKNARLLAKWLNQIEGVKLCTKEIHTNMVFCEINFELPLTAEIFISRLKEAGIIANLPDDAGRFGAGGASGTAGKSGTGLMRFVTHNDVREVDVRRAADVIKGILTKDFW